MAELDGLDAILDFLAALDYPTAQSSIHSALLACLKALMNNSVSSEVAFVCKFRIVLQLGCWRNTIEKVLATSSM